MWLLPSRGRPHNLRRFIEAWHKTESSTPLTVIIDQDDPSYLDYLCIILPPTWQYRINPARKPLLHLFNDYFDENPDLDWYGSMDDDAVPETTHWDKKLVEEAGKDYIAWGFNGCQNEKLAGGAIVGGNVARKMGGLALRGLKRLYQDTYFTEWGRKYNILRYREDVRVIHYHFSNGLAPFDATYEKPEADEDAVVFNKWLNIFKRQVFFVTVNAGDYCGRGIDYTNILFDSIRRNVSENTAYTFQVFTDSTGYDEGIIARPLHGQLEGWWNKVYLFKEGLFPEGSLIVYFDLDTCITSSLDEYMSYGGDFAILRDFYRPKGLGSGAMIWTAGKHGIIWDAFDLRNFSSMDGGDQEWIEQFFYDGKFRRTDAKADILQELYPLQFISYKEDAKFLLPQEAHVVCFHGYPKPHEINGGWVPYVWVKGGGSVLHHKAVGNVKNSTITAQIRETFSKNLEHLADQYVVPNNATLCIVGGGPSLAHDLEELKERQENGDVIWALNNAFNYLKANGIYPHCQVMLDARPENAEFVPDDTKALLLYASQCHEDVFAKARGKVMVWNSATGNILDLMKEFKIRSVIVQNCTSVGVSALGLAQMFGFRDVHLFGYDSSYTNGHNHAYPQPLNDAERRIEVTVNGEKFECAPWMATQVEDFKRSAQGYLDIGMVISVHGNGLLPYVARLMTAPKEPVAIREKSDVNSGALV